ncbi:MAG: hypothetical protein HC893_13430, partial [Chloroflexaceae bacterium]|nr:hypothetical protein [Chloroflexaceae bacterium]
MQHHRVGLSEYVLFALLIGLAGLSLVMFISQIIAPQTLLVAGLVIDRLSAAIALLVASVGVVVFRFSLRYLDGEPGQVRFLHWLFLTILAAYLLMIAANLLLLFAAWAMASTGLHNLLTFYQNRAEALRPARKKFLISRLGDIVLLSAIFLIWNQWGTLNLYTFLEQVNEPATWAAAPSVVAMLIVVAALTKSAQFPFHSWLPETMESPTPVSALMHAGIINAGGVLVLRFAPLLVVVPAALFNLALVGTITTVLGLLAMWSQTNIKRTLAWSTVSQMGFMMIQIGLAAFPAALLHIVGHGFYKAWSFLRTGDLPPSTPATAPLAPALALVLLLVGVVVAVPAILLASMITGFDPLHSPGELALTAIVALAMGHVWIAFFRARPATGSNALAAAGGALLTTFLAVSGAFALYTGALLYLARCWARSH